jgi:predicted GTPase
LKGGKPMPSIEMLNPSAKVEKKESNSVSKLERIEGKRIAFLDNLKPQSEHVLYGIKDFFDKYDNDTAVFKKIDTPTPVPEPIVQEIKDKYHALVTGVGD